MKIITDKLIKGFIPKLTYTKKHNNHVMSVKHMYEIDKKYEEFMEALNKIDGLIRGGSNENK